MGRPKIGVKIWDRTLTEYLMKQCNDLGSINVKDFSHNTLTDLCICSICKDIIRRPVMLPCQHSFCLMCLVGKYQGTSLVLCPQCKEQSVPKDVKPSKIMEELLTRLVTEKNKLTATPPIVSSKAQEQMAVAVIRAKLADSKDKTIEFASGGPNVSNELQHFFNYLLVYTIIKCDALLELN